MAAQSVLQTLFLAEEVPLFPTQVPRSSMKRGHEVVGFSFSALLIQGLIGITNTLKDCGYPASPHSLTRLYLSVIHCGRIWYLQGKCLQHGGLQ